VYVTCFSRSCAPPTRPENNDYKNPFGSEIALFRTNDGGMSRMAVTWDIRQNGGERGRIYGQKYNKVAVNTSGCRFLRVLADTADRTATS